MPFSFLVQNAVGRARAGIFATPHGDIATPAFMPVGTLATVKALDPDDLRRAGASMVLSNAYHLHLRPGDTLVREMLRENYRSSYFHAMYDVSPDGRRFAFIRSGAEAAELVAVLHFDAEVRARTEKSTRRR